MEFISGNFSCQEEVLQYIKDNIEDVIDVHAGRQDRDLFKIRTIDSTEVFTAVVRMKNHPSIAIESRADFDWIVHKIKSDPEISHRITINAN